MANGTVHYSGGRSPMVALDSMRRFVHYLMPAGSGVDDAPRVQAAANALAYLGKVILGPGAWSWQTPCVLDSGAHIEGGVGVTIVSTITPTGGVGDYARSVFLSLQATAGTATTLSSGVAIGSYTALIAANTISVGDTVVLSPTGVTNVAQVLRVVAKSGSSTPWTLTFDAPVEFAMGSGSSIQSVANPRDICIDGKGMTITGTGDRALEFGAAEDCHVSRIDVSRTSGGFTSIVMSFDVGGRNNTFSDITIDGNGAQACLALECNVGSTIDLCVVSYATAGISSSGFYLPTCKRCTVTRSIARKCNFGIDFDYSGAGDLESSHRCSVSDSQFLDSTAIGVRVAGGKLLEFSNVIVERSGTYGFGIFNGLAAAQKIHLINCAAIGCTSDGFLLEGLDLKATNCVAESGGSNGFAVNNDALDTPTVSSVTLNGCSVISGAASGVYLQGAGARCLVTNLTTKNNSGAALRITGVGADLFVNGWLSEDDGLSGVSGLWDASQGNFYVVNAHVKNVTSTALWIGVQSGTGVISLTNYIAEMVGGSGTKAVVNVQAAGTLLLENVRTIGTLTYGVVVSNNPACKISRGRDVDLSSCSTPYEFGAATLANFGTFTANGTSNVTVNGFFPADQPIAISFKTLGGTQGAEPTITSMSANTFNVKATASDTSVYNWKAVA